MTNVVIKLETAEAPSEDVDSIELNQSVEVQGASFDSPVMYSIDLAEGNYEVLVDGSAANLCGWDDDFAVRDGSGELISVNTITVITVAANGTYTIEVYADTTFKVVAKEA